MSSDPGLYDYLPYRPPAEDHLAERRAGRLLGRAEHRILRVRAAAEPARTPWARPVPDVLAYSHRDYGNRAGVVAHDGGDGRAAASAASSRSTSRFANTIPRSSRPARSAAGSSSRTASTTRATRYGMNEDQERAHHPRTRSRRSENAPGQKLAGWLSPALSNNTWTMDLLAEIRHHLHLRPVP